jgi:hypothetical protein
MIESKSERKSKKEQEMSKTPMKIQNFVKKILEFVFIPIGHAKEKLK